jgi:uncharacterized protein (TIGR00156 family)
MKKLTIFLVLMVFVFTGSAYAGFRGPGMPAPDTVAAARKAKHGTRVTLEGYIVKQVGDEKYLFSDATDQVKVEILDEVWRGQEVNPQTTVRVSGEVDKDISGIEIKITVVEVVAK